MNRFFFLVKDYLKTPQYLLKNIRWKLPLTKSNLNIIFVVGAPRSGTTLLHTILNSHSRLYGANYETGIFSYKNIFSRKYFNITDSEWGHLIRESRDVVSYFENAVALVMHNRKEKYFVEKTPQHIMYLKFILKHFAEAKIIHIVRDGRDCYCSAKKSKIIPQGRKVGKYARYWKKCVKIPLSIGRSNR